MHEDDGSPEPGYGGGQRSRNPDGENDRWEPPVVFRTVDEARRGGGRRRRQDDEARTPDEPPTEPPADIDVPPTAVDVPSTADEETTPVSFVSSHLRAAGPRVTHFSGRVIEVAEAHESRSVPSASPVVASLLALAVVALLPVAIRVLPLLALVCTLVLLFRPGKVFRWARRRRRGSAARERLQTTSFRVRVPSDSGEEYRDVDCRLVLRAEDDTEPLLGGETVTGHGRFNRTRTVLDVREMTIDSPPCRYRSARFRSAIPGVVVSVVAILAAAALFYGQRDRLRILAGEQVTLTVVAVVAPVVVVVAVRVLLRRRRSRKR